MNNEAFLAWKASFEKSSGFAISQPSAHTNSSTAPLSASLPNNNDQNNTKSVRFGGFTYIENNVKSNNTNVDHQLLQQSSHGDMDTSPIEPTVAVTSAPASVSVLESSISSACSAGCSNLSSMASPDETLDIMRKFNANYNVQVIQQDSNSPYQSISAFEDLNLHENLLKGLYNKKFDRPSKIQAHALPLLLKDPPQHLVAQAQSGTGKTAAFCLSILSRLKYDDPSTQAIVLSPTRELTLQTVEVMKELARFTTATIATVVYQINRNYSNVIGQIVIGTPGTVERLIKTRHLNVNKVVMLVLDEADTMLDMQSLGQQCHQVKSSLENPKLLPRNTQLVLFSATYATHLERFVEGFFGNSEKNEIRLHRPEELSIHTIHQFYIDCENEEDRFMILTDLYKIMTVAKSMIFVQARVVADKITKRLIARGHQVSFLHGALTPEERDERMDNFRKTQTKVLVATDVLARGIDVCDVNMVINYDLPTTIRLPDRKVTADPDVYLHRIGRTGRFGRRGVAINFVHSPKSYEILRNIQLHYGCDIHKIATEWEHLEGATEAEKKEARLENIELFIKQCLKST
ncbi:RNA helicase required for poly(A+) mRNA export [Linnemannia zychae]|nr:RNA helicase required for poly(A+) mRNA export [Linnemannia zychae]